jgi:hypothetical protein
VLVRHCGRALQPMWACRQHTLARAFVRHSPCVLRFGRWSDARRPRQRRRDRPAAPRKALASAGRAHCGHNRLSGIIVSRPGIAAPTQRITNHKRRGTFFSRLKILKIYLNPVNPVSGPACDMREAMACEEKQPRRLLAAQACRLPEEAW